MAAGHKPTIRHEQCMEECLLFKSGGGWREGTRGGVWRFVYTAGPELFSLGHRYVRFHCYLVFCVGAFWAHPPCLLPPPHLRTSDTSKECHCREVCDVTPPAMSKANAVYSNSRERDWSQDTHAAGCVHAGYTPATRRLQAGYTPVRLRGHARCTLVTRLLHARYTPVTRRVYTHPTQVTCLVHGCYTPATWQLHAVYTPGSFRLHASYTPGAILQHVGYTLIHAGQTLVTRWLHIGYTLVTR